MTASTDGGDEQADLAQRVDAVMVELESTRSRAGSSLRSIALLLGSAALFVVIGAWFWSMEIVLYLVPILLFHELGHYAAMRYFSYRNVKMFFLPLLGAAVSGQHFNVPGWKKVLVSLAGPLPGILLAIPMAVIAIRTQNELWRNATLMLVAINVFNLIPLLPLDGGWVAHALFFCRQPWLDVLFRLAAAIAMISIGVTWQLHFFTGFGALMLLAVPGAVRSSNIAKRVNAEKLDPVPDDITAIPRSMVERIVAHLPTAGPAALPKPLAQQTRQIFDVLNVRPPSIVATVLLTLLYLAGWVISFGVLAAVVMWPQWQQRWTEAPVVVVSSDSNIRVYRADQQPVDDHASRYLVQGTCEDEAAVESCVLKLQQHVDCRFAFATVGNSVLLSVDVDEAESDPGSAMIADFKASVRSHRWFETDAVFHFQIECSATTPQQAEKIVHQANEMLMFGNDLGLIEPWSPEHEIVAEQLDRRETRRVLDAPFDAAGDPVLLAFSEALDDSVSGLALDENIEAGVENPSDPVRQRMEQYDLIYEERYEAAVERMKADESGKYDSLVLKHWDRRPGRFQDERLNTRANTMEEKSWRSKLADLLGRIPGTVPVGIDQSDDLDTAARSAGPFKYSMTAGVISSNGRRVQFQFCHFRNPITGLPALLQWLRKNGCDDLQFQILENLDLSSLSFGDES
jgi:Zn-dependent protease